jgi:hypothetical protein
MHLFRKLTIIIPNPILETDNFLLKNEWRKQVFKLSKAVAYIMTSS